MPSWTRNIDWPDTGISVALIVSIYAVLWLIVRLLGG